MNEILNTGNKVRIIALGCGSDIPHRLMVPGSSQWLHSINLPYDMDEVDTYGGAGTKFVSKQRVQAIFSNLPILPHVIDIVISGQLTTINEREGRDNKMVYAVRVGGQILLCAEAKLSTKSRQEQEYQVSRSILNSLRIIKSTQTRVVYPGSFNPVHDGHRQVVKSAEHLSAHATIVEMTSNHINKSSNDVTVSDVISSFSDTDTPVSVEITDKATYLEKYELFSQRHPNHDIIFLMGNDIWAKWSESLKADFKDINNAQFLVFSRGNVNKAEKHKLLHPLSWTQEPVNISSSEIRNGR